MSTIYQEFTYGDIASLRGNSRLVITSPRGVVSSFPPSVHRVQRFRVEELGTWTYEWGDGMRGEFVVVPASIPELPKPPSIVKDRVSSRSEVQKPAQTSGESFFVSL